MTKQTLAEVSEYPKNIYISPFSDWIAKGLVKDWCKNNPLPETFDENDSWHWAIKGMHDLLAQLEK